MNWIIANMRAIMLVSGALTCTMLYAAIDPQASLRATFGDTLQGPLAEIVVRNWGALIAMVGAMLIYGAYDVPSRRLILSFAAISKLVFVSLILIFGRQYLGHQAGPAIVFDALLIVVYLTYLLGTRGGADSS